VYAGNKDRTMNTQTSSYDGTNISGSQGGELIAAVYGNESANQIKNYYKNMNLIA
jgi:hypothetical protein